MTDTIIFIDKDRARANTNKSIKFAVVALIFLVVVNYLSSFFHRLIIPTIAGGVILIAIINVVRNVLLSRLPFMILNNDKLKYFSFLSYTKKSWNKIGRIKYYVPDKLLQLETQTGGIIDKIQLDIINDSDISMIIDYLKKQKELIQTQEELKLIKNIN